MTGTNEFTLFDSTDCAYDYFDCSMIDRENEVGWHKREYIVAPQIDSGDSGVVEGTWSEPRLSVPGVSLANYIPIDLEASERNGSVILEWGPPTNFPIEEIEGYRVFRSENGNNFIELTPTNEPHSLSPFTDLTASSNTLYKYVITTVSKSFESVTGDVQMNSVWDDLWEFHENLNTDKDLFVVNDATIIIGKYKIDYVVDNPERSITIATLDEWKTQYKLRNNYVDYRFDIHFESSDIELVNISQKIAEVEKIEVDIQYERPYTLAVLMRDTRDGGSDPLGKGNEYDNFSTNTGDDNHSTRLLSALCAKPIGSTILNVPDVKIDVSVGPGLSKNAVVGLVIGVVATVAAVFAGIVGGIVAAFAVLALATYLSGVATLEGIEAVLEWRIGVKVKDKLQEDQKGTFDHSPIMDHAGEGLAEAFATRVLRKILEPGNEELADFLNVNEENIDNFGRNRFREQFWQSVLLMEDKWKVNVRKLPNS